MLQKEFEDRIGRSVTFTEYETANGLYMAAGNMDKDEFCAEYKRLIENSPLARELEKTIAQLKTEKNNIQCQLRREQLNREGDGRRLLGIAHEVREGGMEASADQLDEFGAFLVGGRGKAIHEKLAKSYALTKEDLDYIQKNLE
jgi:hypothetical protein